jgi:ketosteroid isomerase-like protein
MSEENVEIVRAAVAAADPAGPDVAAMNRLFDRDHEFHAAISGLEDRAYRGMEGYRRYQADMADAWGKMEVTADELIDAGGEMVVAIVRYRGRGKGSGAPIDERLGMVLRLRNGRVWRSETYSTVADALKAAGLSE